MDICPRSSTTLKHNSQKTIGEARMTLTCSFSESGSGSSLQPVHANVNLYSQLSVARGLGLFPAPKCNIRLFRWTCLVIVLLFIFPALSAFAQYENGSILGTIRDASGAPIAGADVSIVNTATGISTQSKTDGSGDYDVPSAARRCLHHLRQRLRFRHSRGEANHRLRRRRASAST